MKGPKRDKSSRRRTTVAASLALAGTLLAVPYIAQAATADEPVSGPVQAPPSELGPAEHRGLLDRVASGAERGLSPGSGVRQGARPA